MIHYSCIGATGYVCGEVLRMMVNHPDGELVNVLDTYGVGDAISTHHPALRGFYDQVIMDLTEENVTRFVEDFLEGRYKPYWKSEPAPEEPKEASLVRLAQGSDA